MLGTFFESRVLAGLFAALLGSLAWVGGGSAAETGALHLRCTNVASGSNWPIVVDLDRKRVDATPATITDRQISWSDEKLGVYELERASGKLLFRGPSSTGGYFLYYTCKSE